MSSLEDYNKNKSDLGNAKRKNNDTLKGYDPGYKLKGNEGEITSKPQTDGNITDFSHVLKELELDPKLYDVVEPVEVRSWDSMVDGGTRLFYYKAKIVSKKPRNPNDPDYDKLVAQVKKVKKPKLPKVDKNDSVIIAWSDWQLGKPDGDGTTAIVERLNQMIPDFKDYVLKLRKGGKKLKNLHIISLGDIIENCSGHYDTQTFGVQLNLRDQVKVARRIMVKAITEWAPLFDNVVISAIHGNHGENRNNGKTYTDFADNHDVAIVEQVQEILSQNQKAFKHVKFQIPESELSATVEVSGKIVGMVHGHQFRSGVSVKTGRYAFDKGIKWFAGQCMGREPIGDADLILSGHFHHYFCISNRGRWFMQAPSVDGGSEWFKDISGDWSPPAQVAFTVSSEDKMYFWDNLKFFPYTC